MEHDRPHTLALLARTPAVVDALLRELPDEWTMRNEGGETWRAFDVVGHLVHTEKFDWIPRVRHLVEAGESRPFPSVNRDGHADEIATRSLAQLLDEFAALRGESLRALTALKLTDADLARRGTHSVFGTVTLAQLLATWSVHDLTHLHQLTRVLAHQYHDAVGPWIAYLGVLHCDGHSE
jgi:hypothetical protein